MLLDRLTSKALCTVRYSTGRHVNHFSFHSSYGENVKYISVKRLAKGQQVGAAKWRIGRCWRGEIVASRILISDGFFTFTYRFSAFPVLVEASSVPFIELLLANHVLRLTYMLILAATGKHQMFRLECCLIHPTTAL
jgi:hypothetical protein